MIKALAVCFALSMSFTSAIADRTAPPVDTTSDLIAQRLISIARLAQYRDARKFTTNDNGFPVGIFRDREGDLCAMASLIAQSGRTDLVDGVAAINNGLKLRDVTHGPLMDWMLSSGLTQEEIDMVQGALDLNEAFYIRNNIENIKVAAEQEVVNKIDAAIVKLQQDTPKNMKVVVDRNAKHRATRVDHPQLRGAETRIPKN